MSPRVSAIITTCGRPQLVLHAVRSALGQTLEDIEVIVVVDGDDPLTRRALQTVEDPRLRVHVRAVRRGQGAALNCGIALARAEWLALLDDDDEWLPHKLERQLRSAESADVRNPVVGCRFIARSETGDAVWPRRKPVPGEPISEYLFCRHRFAFGEALIPTSMIFGRTALFRAVPFDEHLRRHCDLDWLVRADQREDVAFQLPAEKEPLAIWQMQQGRSRMSNDVDWRHSYEWVQSARAALTPRAYAGFLLTWVSFSAKRQGERSAFAFLLRKAFRDGRPNAIELAVYFAVWTLPMSLRDTLSRAFGQSARGAPSADSREGTS